MFATFRKLLLLILGIPFLLLGAYYLADGSKIVWTYWQSGHWVQTQALIVDVAEVAHPDQIVGTHIEVYYDYTVHGELYSGTRICPFQECPDPEIKDILRTAQENNTPLPLWVNPEAPKTAILFRHMHTGHIILTFSVGLFCLFTGGSATAFGMYMLRAQGIRPAEKTV